MSIPLSSLPKTFQSATSTTSIDEADTELQSRTLKGPDIAHLSMFIRASKPIQAIEAGRHTTLNRSTRLSPELQNQERTDERLDRLQDSYWTDATVTC